MELLSEHQLLLFVLQLFLLVALGRFLGELFRHWKQPPVVGEILAGVLLGPTILGNLLPAVHETIFPPDPSQLRMLETISWLAVLFLLLAAGLEVDLSIVRREGKPAVLTALFGLAVPFGLGVLFAVLLPEGYRAGQHSDTVFFLFVGVACSICAIPVILRILHDLDLLKTDVGLVILAAGTLNDLIGWILFTMILGAISGAGVQLERTAHVVVMTGMFVIICLTVGRVAVDRLLVKIQQSSIPQPGGILTFVFSLALLCGLFTQWIGIHALFGFFLAGIMVGESPHLKERTRQIIEEIIFSLFAPIFFVSIGLKANFFASFDPLLVFGVLVVVTVGKVLGSALGASYGGFSAQDSLSVGLGMNVGGAMEIIIAVIALQYGLIQENFFEAFVIMAVVTSLMAGPLLSWSVRRRKAVGVTELVAQGPILLQLASTTKEDALRELVQQVAEEHSALDAETLEAAVLAREAVMSTGLEKGLAVPHARLKNLRQPIVAFGRSVRGIEFNSFDGRPAHYIFLVLTPVSDQGIQVQLLAAISRALKSDATRQSLLRAASREEVVQAFGAALQAQPPPSPKPATETPS